MDLNTITDIDKLKSLGFDQMADIERAQTNLRAINVRIQQLQDGPKDADSVAKEAAPSTNRAD